MKFKVPNAISRVVAQKGLLASDKAPTVLFVGGVVGMVGSTVLACRATLKLEAIVDKVEYDLNRAKEVKHHIDVGPTDSSTTYSDSEYRRDRSVITARGVGKVVRLYTPSILLGAASIAALTKSHNLLLERNVALIAAYTAVDSAFTNYRERVIERYGEETDRELHFETEEVEILDEETGKLETVTRATGAPGSPYSRFYAEWSSANWSPDPDINMLFLSTQQNWLNDRLKVRGHVFLNEVYDVLGLSHTRAGSQVGWLWHPKNPKDAERSDNFIDFGIWDGVNEAVNDFFHGTEGEILLDFNVDGIIWDRIDESERVGR